MSEIEQVISDFNIQKAEYQRLIALPCECVTRCGCFMDSVDPLTKQKVDDFISIIETECQRCMDMKTNRASLQASRQAIQLYIAQQLTPI